VNFFFRGGTEENNHITSAQDYRSITPDALPSSLRGLWLSAASIAH